MLLEYRVPPECTYEGSQNGSLPGFFLWRRKLPTGLIFVLVVLAGDLVVFDLQTIG